MTTRANSFEERKHQHIERGYRVEEESSVPVNGFCSFIAVRKTPVSDTLAEVVNEALNRSQSMRGIGEVSMSLDAIQHR